MALKDPTYWKDHYVVETDAAEIERDLRRMTFVSDGEESELVYFERGPARPNILVSQGSGGHAYVFAELAYLMYRRGYNVFVMPKHGGRPIAELLSRHADALACIADRYNGRIGVFAEGLGGFAVFYLALAQGAMKSLALQNAPAILTEESFHAAVLADGDMGARRRLILPPAKFLAKIAPQLRLPLTSYLDFEKLIDTDERSRGVETRLVKEGNLRDPDFDRWYPLRAIISLLTTPPPGALTGLTVPTLLLVARRGFASPAYFRDLYDRLPPIKK